MQSITTIGLDIAMSVFQVHGIDAEGHVARPIERSDNVKVIDETKYFLWESFRL